MNLHFQEETIASPPQTTKKIISISTRSYSGGSGQRYHQDQPVTSQFEIDSEPVQSPHLFTSQSFQEKQNDKHTTDRFIPLRKHVSSEASQSFNLPPKQSLQDVKGKQVKQYKITLDQVYRSIILQNSNKLLNFTSSFTQSKIVKKTEIIKNSKQGLENQFKLSQHLTINKKDQSLYRKIGKTPIKVLDAPNLQDDFYLNLLQWSSTNILSVALDSSLYFWNANNNRVMKFLDLVPNSIASVHWNNQGTHISVGTSQGTVQIWDAVKNSKISQYDGHSSRVSSIAWNDSLIASGSRDRSILIRDIRQRGSPFSKYQGHTQQVCGLKWSFDGGLLASGGNDNKLCIWSPQYNTPVSKLNGHCAAVKGLAWSPHNHGVLASGGGSADRTIKFWNTMDGSLMDSIDTGSQVCNLMYSKNTKQIVSTHGYSNNQIIVWNTPSLQKMATLTGHTSRVLFLAMNPLGDTIVTGAGDETLRFWKVFPQKNENKIRCNGLSTMDLR